MSYASLSSFALWSTCEISTGPNEGTSNSAPEFKTRLTGAEAADSVEAARLRYRWCQRWTESLTGLRRQFDGDLDQYLLLLVFEQAEMARVLTGLEASLRKDRPVRSEPRGMNAMSIAEICGIPRETARRKLKRLIARQAINLGPDGLYYLAGGPFLVPDPSGVWLAPALTPAPG